MQNVRQGRYCLAGICDGSTRRLLCFAGIENISLQVANAHFFNLNPYFQGGCRV